MIYRVYGLRIAGEQVFRWIGLTCQPVTGRLQGHFSAARGKRSGLPVSKWLLSNTDAVEAVVLDVAYDRWSGEQRERDLISALADKGHPLFNIRKMPIEKRIGFTPRKAAA